MATTSGITAKTPSVTSPEREANATAARAQRAPAPPAPAQTSTPRQPSAPTSGALGTRLGQKIDVRA
ncbi:MAG: hypothetical protein HQM09_15710 [Candidatus Riflebacteria bacterium]|nr:hypothetical protein [Candidatus Riflebacteria bacterium]